MKFPFGKTRICLAGRSDDTTDHRDAASLTVASKFTRFSHDFFHRRGIPVNVIKLDGSVELAPVLGLAPYIVDLVETGSTLKAHNLEVKEVLGETAVHLVANPAFYKYHYETVDKLVRRLRDAL